MKVLEFFEKEDLKPVGGPAGYLYNLNQQLEKDNNKEIYFIEKKDAKSVKSYLKDLLKKNKKLYDYLYKKRNKNRVIRDVNSGKYISNIDLSQYDIIHFHGSLSMYMVKDSLNDYKGIVIFTTHSPKVSYKEIIEDNTLKSDYLKHKREYDDLKKIDEYAFNRADYIMLPVEEAEECYYNTWNDYKEIKEKNKHKYFYIPTGLDPFLVSETKNETREKYSIPKDAFVICYVGRHNEVKGYDKLKLFGKKILNDPKFKNVYFLIGGKEEPIKGLDHERWIEIGWTNQPHELINSSDLFILPNKETYFDLILLEIMCIGKPVFLTNTGGNKYLKKFKDSGLIYYNYDNFKESLELLKDTINRTDLEELGIKNKQIFNKNFTIEQFAKKYTEKLKEIYIKVNEDEKCN